VRARRDVLFVVAAALAFSTSGPLGKVAAEVPAVTVAAARTGVAALVLFLVSPRGVVSALAALGARERRAVALAGALLAAHFALFLGGLGRTSLAAAVSLVSLEPLAVVACAFAVFGLRPSPRELVGLLVATAGAVVVASGAGVGEHRLSGDLNPLHADPEFAKNVGFERGPILHGLCSFGFMVRHLAKGACGGDASRIKAFEASFKRPVWPGDTLVTEGWLVRPDAVALQVKVKERDEVVIGGAWALLAG